MRVSGLPCEVKFYQESGYSGLLPDAQSPALALARELLGQTEYGVAPFGADAGYFQQGGIPTVLVGQGSISQAHKPNEFAPLEQLSRCLNF